LPHRVKTQLVAAKDWLTAFGSWAGGRPSREVPPPKGMVRFGTLRRLSPISRVWGFDRGTPIDRHYIEEFLRRYSQRSGYVTGDIRGHVMEVGGDHYARVLGGWGEEGSPVERVDILHGDESNPEATIVGDFVSGDGVPSETFDCVVCTQTLHLLYDVESAVRTIHRSLKPGGVLLATLPGITQTAEPDIHLWGDNWRFTTRSATQLFGEVFGADGTRVEAFGNVLTATAFLYGLAAEELRPGELAVHDPQYQVTIGVRAQKAGDGSAT
jgi:SAM-dependent methyltransferase